MDPLFENLTKQQKDALSILVAYTPEWHDIMLHVNDDVALFLDSTDNLARYVHPDGGVYDGEDNLLTTHAQYAGSIPLARAAMLMQMARSN